MKPITDRFDHSIDDKKRLAIPSIVRSNMNPETDGTFFYLTMAPGNKCLVLYPEKLFDQLAEDTIARVPEDAQPDARRIIYGTSTALELDKQGRVVIPDRYIAKDGNPDSTTEAILTSEVTIVGAGDRLEIWDRKAFAIELKALLANSSRITPALQRMYAARVPARSPAAAPAPAAPAAGGGST